MTSTFDSSTAAAAKPSRREIVAATVAFAAAAGAAGSAQAQTPPTVRSSNPPGMSNPSTYSHVVEVNGPHRTIYIAGQTGAAANGKLAESFGAQAIQVMENLKTALASVGGGFGHVVKLNSYMTNIDANGSEFLKIRSSYFLNKSALPTSTLVQVARLGNPAQLLEVEAIAVLPLAKEKPKGARKRK